MRGLITSRCSSPASWPLDQPSQTGSAPVTSRMTLVSTRTRSVIAAEFLHRLVGALALRAVLPDPGHSVQALAHFLRRAGRGNSRFLNRGTEDLPRLRF